MDKNDSNQPSLRDLFAMHAMRSFADLGVEVTNMDDKRLKYEFYHAAIKAYDYADAMMKARQETEGL